MDNDISLLRRCIEDRSPILLLGAGFSLGAKGRNGQKLMLGGALAQRLYEEIIIPNKDLLTEEALDTASLAIKWGNLFAICNVIRENNLTTQRDTLFQEWMSECTYNDAPYFSNLIKVDWKYIFTLNIDDIVEHIFKNEAHSYIDMNIKYYSKLHMVPSRDTWLAMNACLDKYVNNANRVDRLLGDLFSNMCKFAKTNGLEIEHEQDVRRRLNQKVYDSTYVATEWSIDELPLYE